MERCTVSGRRSSRYYKVRLRVKIGTRINAPERLRCFPTFYDHRAGCCVRNASSSGGGAGRVPPFARILQRGHKRMNISTIGQVIVACVPTSTHNSIKRKKEDSPRFRSASPRRACLKLSHGSCGYRPKHRRSGTEQVHAQTQRPTPTSSLHFQETSPQPVVPPPPHQFGQYS